MTQIQRRTVSLGIVATLLIAVRIVPFLTAESEEQSPELPETERPQKVIVLETGRVILGDIVDRPGGYLVKERFGSAVIPYGKVRLTAADLPDAYRKLTRMVTDPTASSHLALAKWCRENQLYGSAKFEIKQALMLEPERKEARQFLRDLEQELETGPTVSQGGGVFTRGPLERASEAAFPGQPWKSRIRPVGGTFETEEPKSVAGLSPDVVQSFVQEVQPILVNKCGNVRCHGQGATNDFRLSPAHRGRSGFRIFTGQNLSSVLREIDSQNPSHSPLLVRVQEADHGGTHKPLFIGPSADVQFGALQAWVQTAAAEQAQQALVNGNHPHPTLTDEPHPPTGPLQDSFLEEILAEDHPDKFDPAVFNRLVHGSSGGLSP